MSPSNTSIRFRADGRPSLAPGGMIRPKFHYGDDTTYGKGIRFLDGIGPIEDWGMRLRAR